MSIWSKKEISIIKKNKFNLSINQLSELLPKKTYFQIQLKRKSLLGTKTKKTSWTKKEDEKLTENKFKNYDDLRKLFPDKTISQLRHRKKFLKISYKDKRLSEKDINFIKNNFHKLNDEELAEKLGKDIKPTFVRKFRKKNKLKKDGNPTAIKWTKDQISFIKENYPHKFSATQIAKKFNLKSKNSVLYLTKKIGIRGRKKKVIWSKSQDELLKKNIKKDLNELIKDHFPGLNRYEIEKRKSQLNLKKNHLWTTQEIKKLKKLSKTNYLPEIYKEFPNHTKQAVKSKYYKMNLTRPNIDFPESVKKLFKKKNNGGRDLKHFQFKYTKGVFIYLECKKGHVFEREISSLFSKLYKVTKKEYTNANIECPECASKVVTNQNNLLRKLPFIAKYIDKEKHPNLDLSKVYYKTDKIFYFQCIKNPEHKFTNSLRLLSESKIEICPLCRKHWDKRYLKMFLKSLIPLLPTMTQSERWVFFQQSGIFDSTKRNIAFAKQVATQKFPLNEIKKFVKDEPSLVDDILDDPTITSSDYLDTKSDSEINNQVAEQIQSFGDIVDQKEEKFPELKSKDVLKSLNNITSSQFCDKEAIEFLIISKKEKLWRDVFVRKSKAIEEIQNASGNEYVERTKNEFLFEYNHASNLTVPENFNAKTPDGKKIIPNLMQYLTTTRLMYSSRIGNWSGTGAGKTLSAILASRLLNLKFTIITCPNSVVVNWENNIKDAFADSVILRKKDLPSKLDNKKFSYLVLNYEYFQQPESKNYIKKLLSLGIASLIVIDEVHYTKQRKIENISKRKEMIKDLVVESGKKNKNLKVIGMSATPVINNLFEGRSMIELITGKVHKDIETTVNINNCMYLFQKLSSIGTRYLPKYEMGIKEKQFEIDCSDVIEEIRQKGANRISVLDLEIILTKKRILEIVKHLEKKTVIYTHYIKGIGEILASEISKAGFSVGFYTGEDKSGLNDFIKGNIDILIGTSAIGTGVDGLQHVSKKLIFNVLPWTNAEYEQIKGRIYRQGQKNSVEFIIPLTKALINDQEWSWCKTKLDRINFKKTIADASVDGVIPEEHIRSEHQVLQDLMKWLDRLSNNEIKNIERKELVSNLFTSDEKELLFRKRRHGNFTKLNKRWNSSKSIITHKRLQKDNLEWVHYHEEYRKAREDWNITPYKELIKFYKKREGLIIGDFGCGEGFLHKELSSKHTVHSFDHVAIENFVTICDFSKTPINDESLDVAIFCLSMMGSNISEYICEAHRVLRLDGKINIIEATSRFKNLENFKINLANMGFDNIVSKNMWKFTQIVGEKSDRKIEKNQLIKF